MRRTLAKPALLCSLQNLVQGASQQTCLTAAVHPHTFACSTQAGAQIPFAFNRNLHVPSSLNIWASSKPAESQHEDGSFDVLTPPQALEAEPVLHLDVESLATLNEAMNVMELAALSQAKSTAFYTSSYIISFIDYVHTSTELPWCACLFSGCLVLRLMTFPLQIVIQKMTAKMLLMNMDMMKVQKLQKQAETVTSIKERDALIAMCQKEREAMIAVHGDGNKKMLITPCMMALNGAVFMSAFHAVSTMTQCMIPSMLEGGVGWFPNLLEPDPYFLLPVLCSLAGLAQVQYGMLNADMLSSQNKKALNFMRAASLTFIPLGVFAPAALCTMWVANALSTVIQGVVVRSNWFRRALKLPLMEEVKAKQALLKAATDAIGAPPKKSPILSPVLYAHNPKKAKRPQRSPA